MFVKKTLLIVAIALSLCLCSACGLLKGGDGTTTTTGSQGGPTDRTPTLEELCAILCEAAPARIALSFTSHHAGLGALTTDAYLLISDAGSYYYYESDCFLPLDEALAGDKAVGVRTGYLLLQGDSITASSPEIDGALLSELQSYSIRTPHLQEALLAEHKVVRSGSTVTLTARADEGTAGLLFDERLARAEGLTLTVTFEGGDTLLPTALSVEATVDGVAVSYNAAYSYAPAPLPTAATAPTPDLSLWE